MYKLHFKIEYPKLQSTSFILQLITYNFLNLQKKQQLMITLGERMSYL
jgi:hypothetical protein